MKSLKIEANPQVKEVFNNYPDLVRDKILNLRRIIIETAHETEGISNLEETLKWGEPSYLSKHGSAIRIDWKDKTPDQYAIYFKCTSKLVPTFKLLFNNMFTYEGNRAIIFQMEDDIPEFELKKCIRVALIYHKVKKLPALGIS